MEKPENIEHNGLSYYVNAGGYYVTSRTVNGIRKTTYLHRAIYEENFGEIPKGYHVHHKDGNPLNNAPENFECLPAGKHIKTHEPFGEWNSNPENIAERNRKTWENLPVQKTNCLYCGKEFAFKRVGKDDNKFCSMNCASYYHRERNQITVECANCGKKFKTYRYRPGKFCSRGCMGQQFSRNYKVKGGNQYGKWDRSDRG